MSSTKKKECAIVAQEIQMLPVARLRPTPDNARQPVSDRSLKSLARSIRKNGVLQPIIVRVHPTEPDTWEIRAGYRRWRATQLAGLKTIPALVCDLDNEAALSVTITENLQRENLHPLEEATAIQQAIDRGEDLDAVAARLGKNTEFVARRASLTRLDEVWRKAVLSSDSPASRFSPAHLELIARLPQETQIILAEDDFHRVFGRGFPTVKELRAIIDGGLQTLGAMPWPLDDETLEPKAGACHNCPKRSGAQPLLFHDDAAAKNGKPAKSDRCLDPACFDRKQTAYTLRCESQLRAEHPDLTLIQIGASSLSPAAQEAFGNRVRRLYMPDFVKAGDADAVPAMQVDGPKAGKLVYIVAAHHQGTCARSRRHGSQSPTEHKPATLEERRAKHQRRRAAFLVQQAEKQLRSLSVENIAQMLATQTGGAAVQAGTLDIVSLMLSFGTSSRTDRPHQGLPWECYDRFRWGSAEERVSNALHDVVQVWVRRLAIYDKSRVELQAEEARRMCEILGIDYAAIEAEAVRALPQPKSWGLPPENQEPSATLSESVSDEQVQQTSSTDAVTVPQRTHRKRQRRTIRHRGRSKVA